jgi:regulatory protein
VPGPLEAALIALSRRAMTAAAVAGYLRKKGYAATQIDAALKRLADMGYVDDAAYASAFISTKAAAKSLGPRRVRGELARRGVARAVIDAEMAKAAEGGEASFEDATKALEKIVRSKGIPGDRAGRDRIRAALARRGFGGAAIARAMTDLRRRLAEREEEGGG